VTVILISYFRGIEKANLSDKIKGVSYEEIAQKGGGILNSAKKLQETSENELFEQSYRRLEEIIQLGTGAVEIKSGYGLETEAELKMLRVIRKLKENYPFLSKPLFWVHMLFHTNIFPIKMPTLV
jgi:imidazolonepropionase